MNGAYKRTDTTKLAVSALCLALTVAALVGASLIPGTEMTFMPSQDCFPVSL